MDREAKKIQAASHRKLGAALLPLSLDREAPLGLQRQLFDQLREIILHGRIRPGDRLPSSRALAQELSCSRNTVVAAYDQLFAEGYLQGESGSGTYVSAVLPEDLLGSGKKPDPDTFQAERPLPAARISKRGARLSKMRKTRATVQGPILSGGPGLPDTSLFPWDVWNRLLNRHWRQPAGELLRHGDPGGYPPLRRAIASYLAVARGVICDWRQVIITSGGQQCVDLAVKALTDPGESVWIEDPGYAGLRGPLIAADLSLVPVHVDNEGFSLDHALSSGAHASMAIITPSHQYPLGIVMSLARRLQLLDWARESGSYLLEDDYDSEYRYAGRPLSALQSLDRAGRVLYAGTFSKVLFPAIRLGYLVVPENLAQSITDLRHAQDDHPPSLLQPVLADFIEEGHFAAHLRRTRKLHAERQKLFLKVAEKFLSGLLVIKGDEAGMHLLGDLDDALRQRMGDEEASRRAAEAGIVAHALSGYFLGPVTRQALMLGYVSLSEREMNVMAGRLAAALSR